MTLDLIIFIESLLPRHQSVELDNSLFKVSSIKFQFLGVEEIFVSLAKRMKSKIFETSHISLM